MFLSLKNGRKAQQQFVDIFILRNIKRKQNFHASTEYIQQNLLAVPNKISYFPVFVF
jgi:hypothetical protein